MSSRISPNQKISSELLQKSNQLKGEIEQLDDKCAEIHEANPMVPEEIWSSLRDELTTRLSYFGRVSYSVLGPSYELTQDEDQAIQEYGKARLQIRAKKALLVYVPDTLAGLRIPRQKKRITDSLTYLADCFINSDELFFERAWGLYDRLEVAYEKGLLQSDIPADTVSLGGRRINPHILKETYHRLKEADHVASLEKNLFVVLDEENYTKFTFREKKYVVGAALGKAIKLLHEKHQGECPNVLVEDILKVMGRLKSDLRDSFRPIGLWNTLIVSEERGTRRLNI